MRKFKFIPDSFYHIYNRGVDKREVFCDDGDYLRFIYSMYKSNNSNPILKLDRLIPKQTVQGLALDKIADRLTNICYFVLRPTHFHCVLQQKKENGIERFMQKLGTAHTMYFNKKYERSGVLFQGVFKAIPIESESYIMHISRYIHLNPLKGIEPEHREKGARDLERAKMFLRGYKWSSYLHYIGAKDFSFLLNNDLHYGYFKNAAEYEQFVLSDLKLAK